ncbi:hypothetical protein HY493_02745 [Candidatus Woesearchaeota archaeon]|nr:hypothetical protein [Candidatus Woesearchaeota archaeon]
MTKELPLWEKIALIGAWLALMGGLTWLVALKPSITGFVPSETSTQVLDVAVTQNTDFVISTEDPTLMLNLKSFRVWGAVYGLGKVRVTLENLDGGRLLVYANTPKRGLETITGFVSHEGMASTPDDKLRIRPTGPVSGQDTLGKPTELVDGACVETCALPDSFRSEEYRLVVEVDDGTVFKLARVSYEV